MQNFWFPDGQRESNTILIEKEIEKFWLYNIF